ncbi:Na+/H+ antiporter subunit G [Oceanicella actignis]|uniref:Na+/H+ antiporter subunit G n=1 Tax=Oceanicella actignis TaxID=1189325 RepID=UPI0011E7E539|nr:Na+/H+ antiporter subunit G [Oceanicella actignis]TYO91197.1 multicomponent K+:H+ antiporter subunit G [Oceanicella actignis]
MSQAAEILIAASLAVGGVFGLVGSYGLIKLPNLVMRLHAPTKATTLGVGGVLIASMLHSWFALGRFSVHELLITMFLFLTAPVTAHFIAKAHIHRRLSARDLPAPQVDRGWATLERPEDGSPDGDPGEKAEGAQPGGGN